MTKLIKGKKIDTLADLIILLQDSSWIYWNHKPMHPSFLWNMQLRTLRNAVNLGILYIANRRQE